MVEYSIGVTTYSYRYKRFLINLVSEIRRDTQSEIILAINGNYKEKFDEEYRKNILELSAKNSNVFPFIYPNFRSLSKMWNNIVVNASCEYVVLLNDDTTIVSPIFWKTVEDNIQKYQSCFRMDSKFCYFVVKKSELNEVGWFDERFLGIGWEDTEFIARYENYFNKKLIDVIGVPGIKTYIDRENIIVNQRVNDKYSEFNREVYGKNLASIQQYPHEKFYWENKNKL